MSDVGYVNLTMYQAHRDNVAAMLRREEAPPTAEVPTKQYFFLVYPDKLRFFGRDASTYIDIEMNAKQRQALKEAL